MQRDSVTDRQARPKHPDLSTQDHISTFCLPHKPIASDVAGQAGSARTSGMALADTSCPLPNEPPDTPALIVLNDDISLSHINADARPAGTHRQGFHPMFSFKKILVPTCFDEVSNEALRQACDLAERMSGEVTLLHAIVPAAVLPPLEQMPVPVVEFDDEARAQQQLDRLPESSDQRRFVTRRCVIRGDAASVITRFAEENSIDVIVIGTHSHSRIRQFLLGSVTEAVVRKAHCPVLTVPAAVAAWTSASSD